MSGKQNTVVSATNSPAHEVIQDIPKPVSVTQQDLPNAQAASNDTSAQDRYRSRPGSSRSVHRQTTSSSPNMDPGFIDQPRMHRTLSSRSRRPYFRDEWDYGDAADYIPPRYYDRYWRDDYRNGPHGHRMSSRPPPTRFNRGGHGMMSSGSDDETPYDESYHFRDPYDPRVSRTRDEEMGPQPSSTVKPEFAPQQQQYGIEFGAPDLDWNNMSSTQKAQVLRLPLTQWMNSEIKNHFVAALGEFVGTLMFLFFAFAGTEVANIHSEANGSNTTTGESTGFNVATLLYISLAFGFSLMVNVWVFFRISGGLFNPAVTVAMTLVRAITIARAVCLFVAQMAGAIAASAIVRYLFPESFNVRTTLGGGASMVQGIFIEAILTAELVFTIFMLAKEKHRATFIAPVGIGLALFIAELVGVQFTGGSLNPARSFGPCVMTGEFDAEHWIYWVGPIVGSIIAVLFYRFIKTLEYEMANPGADGDDGNDPTKNPQKRAEVQMAKESIRA